MKLRVLAGCELAGGIVGEGSRGSCDEGDDDVGRSGMVNLILY